MLPLIKRLEDEAKLWEPSPLTELLREAIAALSERWQARTLRRLALLGYDGFRFGGGGVNWWPMRGGAIVAGPFHSTAEFDAWLDQQEAPAPW